MTIKIVSIIGARPQFIKAAPVSRLLRKNQNFHEVLVHTGQHYDENMSQIFFDQLEIPRPEYNLAIGSSLHGKQTGEMLMAIEEMLLKEKPDWMLVYGDTNSTLAGALAAAKMHIPIAHVEAGLRSYNLKMPEEVNRLVADQVAKILFAPTEQAVLNLSKEGFSSDRVQLVGDVMYDVALHYGEKAERESDILNRLNLQGKPYILATIHRQENTDNLTHLSAIFNAFCRISAEIPVIFPVHPRTRKLLNQYELLDKIPTGLRLLDPLGFLDMLCLEKNAKLVATDSGGVQKEAFFYQVPCVTLRGETEWVELVELGWNQLLLPNDADVIYHTLLSTINRNKPSQTHNPYGDGHAAEKIVKSLAFSKAKDFENAKVISAVN